MSGPRGPSRKTGLQEAARLIWERFFPPRIELPEEVRQLLAAIYPTLDLRRLTFHRGIPYFLDRLVFSQGMVLPSPLSMWRGRVYVHPRVWDTGSVSGLGLLVHEGFHALQLQDSGPGLGLIRPFTILYLACSAGNGFRYRSHPMERDAYEVAGWSRGRFETLLRDGGTAEERLARLSSLVVPSSRLRFWQRLAGWAPGFRRLWGTARGIAGSVPLLGPLMALLPGTLALLSVLLWLVFWTLAVAVLAVLRGLVEATAALAAGLLWGMGALGRLRRGRG